jgi:hypothetical protein
MFFPGSRYINMTTYQITQKDGTVITVTRLPQPLPNPIIGFFQRLNSQRLDAIAAHFLSDPTTFWKLSDANGSIAPDALATHKLVGIPTKTL